MMILICRLPQDEFNAGTGHDARTRRALPDGLGSAGLYNTHDLQFYIGFVLDGVSKYQNLTDTLPRYARLYVYADPDVYEFEREVLPFRASDEHIVIKVMTSGNCYCTFTQSKRTCTSSECHHVMPLDVRDLKNIWRIENETRFCKYVVLCVYSCTVSR